MPALANPVTAVRRRHPDGGAATAPADARREGVLAAATRHFAARGFHATDLQVLADELELGKGTLYRDFGNKEALFLAAVDRAMRLLHERVDAARGGARDGLDQIARAMTAYLSFFDAHPEFVELLIIERAVFRDRKQPTYFQHRERNVGRWRRLFAELIAAGRVRALPTETITDVISRSLYGTMFVNFFAGRKKSLQTQATELIDVVFRGILSDTERARLRRSGTAARGGARRSK
ncbi:MAG: TetR/AcrR family transcriptional regulator [Phycisphaerae bacterium]